jgi:hypothetical protein
MIVFLTSQPNANLFNTIKHTYVKTYVKWEYDLGDFIKEEYGNIHTMQPEKIIIDENAVKSIEKIELLQDVFKMDIILLTQKELELEEDAAYKVVEIKQKTKLEILQEIFPEIIKKEKKTRESSKNHETKHIKIGIMGMKKKQEEEIAFAFHLALTLKQYVENICCIEVGKENYFPLLKDTYQLEEKDTYYELDDIPLLFNTAMEDSQISIFLFLDQEEQTKRMHQKCDFSIILLDDRICCNEKTYDFDEIRDIRKDNRTNLYTNIFEDKLGFTLEDREQELLESNGSQKKSNRTKKLMKKGTHHKLLQKKFLVAIFLMILSLTGLTGIRFMRQIDSKKEKLQKSIQKETLAKNETTENPTTEERTEEKTETKKEKKAKKEQDTKNEQSKNTKVSTSTYKPKQQTTRRKVTTTARKKPTTTARKKPTTTERKKPSTTEKKKPTTAQDNIKVDYDVN